MDTKYKKIKRKKNNKVGNLPVSETSTHSIERLILAVNSKITWCLFKKRKDALDNAVMYT